jgi:hypothetical protein
MTNSEDDSVAAYATAPIAQRQPKKAARTWGKANQLSTTGWVFAALYTIAASMIAAPYDDDIVKFCGIGFAASILAKLVVVPVLKTFFPGPAVKVD